MQLNAPMDDDAPTTKESHSLPLSCISHGRFFLCTDKLPALRWPLPALQCLHRIPDFANGLLRFIRIHVQGVCQNILSACQIYIKGLGSLGASVVTTWSYMYMVVVGARLAHATVSPQAESSPSREWRSQSGRNYTSLLKNLRLNSWSKLQLNCL
jgi:hypothetical protein